MDSDVWTPKVGQTRCWLYSFTFLLLYQISAEATPQWDESRSEARLYYNNSLSVQNDQAIYTPGLEKSESYTDSSSQSSPFTNTRTELFRYKFPFLKSNYLPIYKGSAILKNTAVARKRRNVLSITSTNQNQPKKINKKKKNNAKNNDDSVVSNEVQESSTVAVNTTKPENDANATTPETGPKKITLEDEFFTRPYILPRIADARITRDLDNGTMVTLCSMANGFARMVLSSFDVMEPTLLEWLGNNTTPISSVPISTFASTQLSFIFCLVVGLLFIAVLPITGTLFFICRFFDKCGGFLYHNAKVSRSLWRFSHCGALFITTLFLLMANVAIFVTNNAISDNLQRLPDRTDEIVVTVGHYINGTLAQMKYLNHSYTLLSRAMVNELSGISESFVQPLLEDFERELELPYGKIRRIRGKVNSLVDRPKAPLNMLASEVKNITQLSRGLLETISSIETKIRPEIDGHKNCLQNPVCVQVQVALGMFQSLNISRKLEENVSFKALEEIDSSILGMRDQLMQHKKVIVQASEFTELPEKIKGQVTDRVDTAASEAISMVHNIDKSMESSFESLPVDQFQAVIEALGKYRVLAADMEEHAIFYDRWRYALSVVCCVLVVIIIALNSYGFFGGVCGHHYDDPPTDRSWCSDCGGKSIYCGVGLSFFLAAALMLICTLSFIIGSNLEKYVCKAFTPTSASTEGPDFIEELIKQRFNWSLQASLGAHSLTLASLISSCQEKSSIMSLLYLDATPQIVSSESAKSDNSGNRSAELPVTAAMPTAFQMAFDFDAKIADLRAQISNSDEVAEIVRSSVAQFNGYSSKMTGYLKDILVKLEAVPFKDYLAEIDNYIAPFIGENSDENSTTISIESRLQELLQLDISSAEDVTTLAFPAMRLMEEYLRTLKPTGSESLDSVLKEIANNLSPFTVYPGVLGDSLMSIREQLKSVERSVHDKRRGVIGDLRAVNVKLEEIQNKINGSTGWSMTEDIIYKIKGKGDMLVGHAETYARWAYMATTEQLGQCGTLYERYSYTLDSVCDTVVDPLNGFWFALACCAVILPFNIFWGTKLSRFYRKMEHDDDYDDVQNGQPIANTGRRSGNRALGSSSYGVMFGNSITRSNPHFGKSLKRRLSRSIH